MNERWRKSWYFWVGIILEILGKKLIGRETSVYPFFTAGVVAVFELCILLKLTYSENLRLYEESADNPKCSQIRWICLLPILAVSYFARTTIWYFWIYFPLTETVTLYFAGTEETKNKIRADISENMKGIAIMLIIIGGVVLYAISSSKSIFG